MSDVERQGSFGPGPSCANLAETYKPSLNSDRIALSGKVVELALVVPRIGDPADELAVRVGHMGGTACDVEDGYAILVPIHRSGPPSDVNMVAMSRMLTPTITPIAKYRRSHFDLISVYSTGSKGFLWSV